MIRRNFLLKALGFFGLTTVATAETGGFTPRREVSRLTVLPMELKQFEPLRVKKLHRLRIWKLGSLEHKIFPTEKAVARLGEILAKWDRTQDLDLIWGPELQVEEHLVTEDEINAIALSPLVRITKVGEDGKLKITVDKDEQV